MREHIPDLPALFEAVRRRPGAYLGARTIHGLDLMLGGIELAEDYHGIPAAARLGGFDFDAFEAWVALAHNPRRLSLRSFGLAAHVAGSDETGFDLWFRWYDEYRAEPARGVQGDRSPSRPADATSD